MVTCQEATNVPFSVMLPDNAAPTLSSAATFERDESSALCGGLNLDMRVGRLDANTVRLTVPIQNDTKFAWQGTVKLDLGGTVVPVRIGRVPAGQSREQTVNFNVDRGTSEIKGALLIGP